MKISFIRGAYLNNFEGQNFDLPIQGYSSLFPIDFRVPFPITRLPSIADLQKIFFLNIPIKYIANRTLGDSQILFGLEHHITGSDIVHVADPHYYYSYQAAILKKQGKIKRLVSTWWETIPFNNEGTKAKKRIKQFVMSEVDRYICYSNRAKECLQKEGVSEEAISLISLGVDVNKFHPPMQKKQKPYTILFVGRLVEEKGILDLYTAFKEVEKNNRSVFLKIVGSGPLETALRKKIYTDNLVNKVTVEQRKYEEMPEVYRAADVLCVPSKKTKTWEEQYGMVFVEAMASGLPIISYNTGAIADVVGDAGLIIKENDIRGLVTSIIRIIEVSNLGKILGTMGRERAERMYDAQKTRDEIFNIYKILNTKY